MGARTGSAYEKGWDRAGWDRVGWGTWQLSSMSGGTPNARPPLPPQLPAPRLAPLGMVPPTQPQEGAQLCQLPRGAGPCPRSRPSCVPAPRQSLITRLGPPSPSSPPKTSTH